MPWKLILFLAALVVATVFIGVNLDNRCDVNLLVRTFKDVPVFVSLLFAYLAGALSVVPFFLKRDRRAPPRQLGEGVDRSAKKARGKGASRHGEPERYSSRDYSID
ncbi:MAG TPA: hypothetical protein PLU93_04505 [Treponemataceae bacterium]|nr:hypothetical protein [Treponemataceae bacterium]